MNLTSSFILSKFAKKDDDKFSPTISKAIIPVAGIMAAGLMVPSIIKKPGLIKQFYKKELKPVILTPKGTDFEVDDIMGKLVFKSRGIPSKSKKTFVNKGEVGLLHGFDYTKHVKPKGRLITPFGVQSIQDMADKLKYGRKLGANKIGASTWKLESKDVKNIRKMTNFNQLKEYLNKKHGGTNWIYKPRSDQYEDVPVAIGKSTLFTPNTKNSNVFKYIKKNPSRYIGQEKLDIQREYRVRTVGNKVVSAIPREAHPVITKIVHSLQFGSKFPKTPFGFFEVGGAKRRELQNLFSKNKKVLNPGSGLNTMSHDVARVKNKNGKEVWKVIETNPASGGEIDLPGPGLKLYKALTGKTHPIETGFRSIGAAGILGTGAILSKNQNKKSEK